MLANFSGVEFLKPLSKFRKRKRKSFSRVHVLHKGEIRKFYVVVVQTTSKGDVTRDDSPEASQMKGAGTLVVSLRGVNFGLWSHLGCSGQNAIMFSRKGLF